MDTGIHALMGEAERQYLIDASHGKEIIIEVGSWKGGSAIAMTSSGATIYCVDTWRGSASDPATTKEAIDNPLSVYRQFLANTLSAGLLGTRIIPMMGRSDVVIDYFHNSFADMVMIDGSHAYADVLSDLRLYSLKLKSGGLLCGHDWHLLEVQKAVKDFDIECRWGLSVPVLDGWGMWEFTRP